MKIRNKLVFLVITTQLLFFSAAIFYFYITAPIQKLQVEYAYFQKLSKATIILRAEMQRLASFDLVDQQTVFDKSLQAYLDISNDVTKLTFLASINTTMKDAVDAVKNLKEMGRTDLESISPTTTELLKNAEGLFIPGGKVSVAKMLIAAAKPDSSDKANMINYQITAFLGKIESVNKVLVTITKIIDEKDVIVADEIAKIQKSSSLTALAAVIILFVLIIILSIFTTKSIGQSVLEVSKNIASMGSGDFTQRFNAKSKDEFGILSQDLNSLLESLNQSLRKIVITTKENLQIREELLKIVTEATASSLQITINSTSIQTQMKRTDDKINNANGEMLGIGKFIKGFHQKLSAQNNHIEETVSAVTEMMASIDNITRIAEIDRTLVESLVRESDQGKNVFDNSFEKVADIAESVSVIQDMAAVITAISSQTNILAMNASIEAAHAGTFGRGFSVVAEEIGKLAEASATSSDEIAHSIANIVVKIREASATRDITNETFDSISAHIKNVSASVSEIYGNVNEMQIGSRQILESTQSLRSTSKDLTDDSKNIEQSIIGIQDVMGELNQISNEVTSNINEIVTGIQSVSDSFQLVAAHTDKIGEIGASLDTAVAVFKIDDTDTTDS